MSQRAISTAERAPLVDGPAAEIGVAVSLVPKGLDLVRVAIDKRAGLQLADGFGNRGSRYSKVASPTPYRPSSVSTFTNTQFVR